MFVDVIGLICYVDVENLSDKISTAQPGRSRGYILVTTREQQNRVARS
jgi:hypothetical protein